MPSQSKLLPKLLPKLLRLRFGLIVGFLLSLSSGAWAASTAMPLDGDQLKQLIVGNTIRGAARASLFNIYYDANGQLSAVFHGRELLAETDSGTWKIKNGNTVCHEFSQFFDGVERCYQWYKTTGQRYVMHNVDVYRIDDLPVWNIRQGNPLGF